MPIRFPANWIQVDKRFVRSITVILVLALTTALRAEDDFASMRAKVLELQELTAAPDVYEVEQDSESESDGRLRQIYFDGLPWKGEPTRVFAWLGVPESKEAKVPGIVLVHGGGGTAFKEWVQLWNEQGFAAISIAVEGQTDERVAESERGRRWKQHEWAGPARQGIFADTDQPLEDQWMYHALADTILANSLLRSLPRVDADKIGVMGISWGGVITSSVIGIDSRFAFAIPTYGCGHLFDADNHWGDALHDNEIYQQVWDGMQRIDRVRMPVLWLSWPKDNHFPLDAQAACYTSAPGPRMVSLIPGMGHSHQAGWRPPDSYAFAKTIVTDGRPWCRQVSATESGDAFTATFTSDRPIDQATLITTTDTGFTGQRSWKETPARFELAGDEVIATANISDDVTAWFINLHSGDLIVSSDYQQRTRNKSLRDQTRQP